jgi:hypothetical protein
MKRGVIGAVVVGLLVTGASPAGGWANGPEGCNSFGAHDWILKKVIRAAGKKANWVRVRVALRATDDPDCRDGIDHASGTWWHVYDRWGDEYGGADEATVVWFRRTKRRLEAGRERAASRALGIMSHFIADVANPMHTDQSNKEEDIHSPYEDDVDERIPYAFRYDGRDATRPGARTRRVARVAHRSYWDLVNSYDAPRLQPQGPPHHQAPAQARGERPCRLDYKHEVAACLLQSCR